MYTVITIITDRYVVVECQISEAIRNYSRLNALIL